MLKELFKDSEQHRIFVIQFDCIYQNHKLELLLQW